MNRQCIVILPVYKSLDVDEQMSLLQAIEMTPNFQKKFVAPISFVLDDSYAAFSSIEIEYFEDSFFSNIQGYNKLMLDVEFYKRFISYKYILIHQMDAYLFKPNLKYWCDRDYDYIGAPWYEPRKLSKYNLYKFIFSYLKLFFNKKKLLRWKHFNNVGNGGLSLRKVEAFIDVLTKVDKELLDKYRIKNDNFFNEDIFWSLEAPSINENFCIPQWNEALNFSIENLPLEAYKALGENLPFGCHAYKQCNPDFWKEFIPYKFL